MDGSIFGLDDNQLLIRFLTAQLLYLERLLYYCFLFSSAAQVEELESDDNELWCFRQEPEHGYVLNNHFFEKQKENIFLWSSVLLVTDTNPNCS